MNDTDTGGVEVIRSAALAGTRHGFLGRRGGVSTGIHAGLNVGLGSDDDRAAIARNRARAVAAVAPGATLVSVHQVHGTSCVVAAPGADDARLQADALVTDRPDLVVGILTADCVPILLADADAGIVAAAHAGHRGALAGIVETTVAAMRRFGATRIAAAVGPCIAQASYEVDDAYRARFEARDPDHARFFVAGRPGHHRFDLEAFVAARLAAAGVDRVDRLRLDTYADADRFYSFRRATHRGEPGYGRQFSLIGLP